MQSKKALPKVSLEADHTLVTLLQFIIMAGTNKSTDFIYYDGFIYLTLDYMWAKLIT